MSKRGDEVLKRAIERSKHANELTPQQEYDTFWSQIQNNDTFAAAISKICKEDFLSYITTLYYLINCNKFMMCNFHALIIKKLQDIVDGKNTKRNLALCLPVGCVAGDTVIRYSRGMSKQITIEEMFGMLNWNKKRGCGQKWSKKIRTYVRSYIEKDDVIKLNEIEKVTFSGYKDVYLLTLEDGKNIKATIDHKIMTKNGWKELGTLTTDDYVMVDLVANREKYSVKSYTAYGYSQVKSIEFIGRQKTYDIWCYENHNFSANDIIIHNSGKSLLTEYFISWCFARTRDNAFVYTSHSEDLITKMSAEIRNICTSPQWVRLFGWRLKKDDRQKTNFSFEGAKNRTGLRAKAINSAITGLDCFDYNELIVTDKGLMKIGSLVEKKENVKILSFNLKTNRFEYKPILRWIKKKNSKFIKVKLDDGTTIKCTPTHRFYTKNGYVEAQNLVAGTELFSNTLNCTPRNIKFFSNSFFRNSYIADKFNLLIRKMFFVMGFRSMGFNNMPLCNVSPVFPSFNGSNMFCTNSEVFSNISSESIILSNSESLFSSNFKRVVRIISTEICSSMTDSILHIFGFSTISKIFKTIIGSCAVKMSNFYPFKLMTDKSPHNKSMNTNFKFFVLFHKAYKRITSSSDMWFNKFPFVSLVSSLLKNCASKTSNSAFVGYLVKSLKSRDCFPNFIDFVSHSNTSYCVTVQDNNNLFIGKSQILASNCGNPAVDGFSGSLVIDDILDAGNAIYEIERENVIRIYNEKLATRRRTANTPTILIMQRLHPEDLVGWVEKNQPDLWDIVKVQALNPDGTSFWEKRYPAEELKMLQKRQTALFQAQYQQEPIVQGGTVIHTEWFKYYDIHPKYDRIFITADTAMKTKEWNDYSVFQVWGKFQQSLYLIDMIRGKWEIPDLLQKAQSLTQKYKLWENRLMLSAVYIEDRGSGIGLIQQLRQVCPTPILPLKPNKKDKVTRLKEVVYYIEAGNIYLPQDKDYAFNVDLLNECEMFSADGSAKHDDIVDTMVYAINVGLVGIGSSIFD